MTDDSARKKAIRARMRETGEKYTEAARAIDALWAQRTLGGLPGSESGRPRIETEGDLSELAPAWVEALEDDLREIAESLWVGGDPAVEVDNFDPIDLVEGDIEQASLVDFFADPAAPVAFVDAYEAEGTIGVFVNVRGLGEVAWLVSAVTGGDVEAFGDAIENLDGGGGFLNAHESAVPVELQLHVEFDPEDATWFNPEIQLAEMPTDVAAERARAHENESYRRLQAMGVEPTDEEIEQMAQEAAARAAPDFDR